MQSTGGRSGASSTRVLQFLRGTGALVKGANPAPPQTIHQQQVGPKISQCNVPRVQVMRNTRSRPRSEIIHQWFPRLPNRTITWKGARDSGVQSGSETARLFRRLDYTIRDNFSPASCCGDCSWVGCLLRKAPSRQLNALPHESRLGRAQRGVRSPASERADRACLPQPAFHTWQPTNRFRGAAKSGPRSAGSGGRSL